MGDRKSGLGTDSLPTKTHAQWQFVGRAGKALQQLEEDEDDEAEGEGENGTLVRR